MCHHILINFQVKGIKGASVVFMHSPFDIAKVIAVDSLHVIFLGITKDLLKYWFDKSNKGSSTSIYSKVAFFDFYFAIIYIMHII